jgi:hypothetical protein
VTEKFQLARTGNLDECAMRYWIGGLSLCCAFIAGTAHSDDIVVSRENIFSLHRSLKQLIPSPFKDPDDPNGLLTIYGNELAKQAYEEKLPQAQAGSLFVNEKTISGKIDAIGVMVKRAVNFDKAHGDWEYFYADRWGAFRNGRLTDCIACHQHAKSPDYVFYPGGTSKQ